MSITPVGAIVETLLLGLDRKGYLDFPEVDREQDEDGFYDDGAAYDLDLEFDRKFQDAMDDWEGDRRQRLAEANEF